ncbi:MAG: hypothetical protein V3V33_14675 [Candidatus Lokiarchaeia archaeon]
MADFSLKIAEYLKKKRDIAISVISGDNEDREYYIKSGYKEVKDIKHYFPRIPLRCLSLDLYEKWNLDKDKLLLTNYVRYLKLGTKTIDHWAVDEKYSLIYDLIYKLFSNRKLYQKAKPLKKIYYSVLKIILSPFLYLPRKKTYEIIRPFHKLVCYFSKANLVLLNLLPKTISRMKWRLRFEHLNIISLINSKKGFGIISKIALQYFISSYVLLKEIDPDIVLIYNGNWITNTSLSVACEKLDIPHYYTETSHFVGYSLFDSLSVWHDGDINFMELPEWDNEKEAKLDKFIKKYIQKYKRGIASIAEDDEKVKNKVPDNKFIFVPLQVMEDTNNIRYSPLVKNMFEFANLVIENAPKGYDIIIKRHPNDMIFADHEYRRSLKRLKEKIDKQDNLHLYHYVDSQVLLKHCSTLITINSTLSMENLLVARVPMVIVGDNLVRSWGFTYDVSTIEEFPIRLKEALEKGVTPEMEKKMQQFLYMYIFECTVKGHYDLTFQIYDKDGKLLEIRKKPAEYEELAERIYMETLVIEKRIKNGLKRIKAKSGKLRCMINRSKISGYQKIILDYVPSN